MILQVASFRAEGKNFSNVTDSSPFRAERMEGNQGGDQVLDSFLLFAIIGLATSS